MAIDGFERLRMGSSDCNSPQLKPKSAELIVFLASCILRSSRLRIVVIAKAKSKHRPVSRDFLFSCISELDTWSIFCHAKLFHYVTSWEQRIERSGGYLGGELKRHRRSVKNCGALGEISTTLFSSVSLEGCSSHLCWGVLRSFPLRRVGPATSHLNLWCGNAVVPLPGRRNLTETLGETPIS